MNPWGYANGERLADAAGVPMSIHGRHYVESGAMARGHAEVAQWPGVEEEKTSPGGTVRPCLRPPGTFGLAVHQAAFRGRLEPSSRTRRRPTRVVDDSPEPKLLTRRVDALYLAYNGELRPDVAAHLAQKTDEAKVQGLAVAVDLDAWGAVLCVSPKSTCARGLSGMVGRWRLSCDELGVWIDSEGTEGWRLEVRPTALLLGRIGHEAARACARELAGAILVDVLEERVRRVDLCADWSNYALEEVRQEEWLYPRRCQADDLSLGHRYSHAHTVTGWAIGKSDVSHRTYDKTRELRAPGNALKRDEEHERWKAAGWSGQDKPGEDGYQPVTRTEFQVRGDALKQFPGLGNLRDPDVLFRSLDGVWAYLTDARPMGPQGRPVRAGEVGGEPVKVPAGWCRLVVTATATRRHRCKTQRRWRAVQRVTFQGVAMPVPERKRVHAPAAEKRMVAQALDLCAVESETAVQIAPHPSRNIIDIGNVRALLAQAKDSHDGWSDEEAERWVRALLEDHRLVARFKLATRSWAETEARRRGWKGAAAYFIERMRAAIAKRGALHDVLLERASLAKCAASAAERASGS